MLLAGVNITDPEKLPKDFAALEASYVRRFGAMTFDAEKVGKAKAAELMREGLLRMTTSCWPSPSPFGTRSFALGE